MKFYLRFLIFIFVFIGLTIGFSPAAEQQDWKQTYFSYAASQVPLNLVLRDFCLEMGIDARISPNIQGVVSGNFQNMAAISFLDLFTQSYGLSWYYDGSTIFFYKSSENQSKIINLGVLSSNHLQNMLTELGLYDARYSWKEWKRGNIIYICAPPRYLEIISSLVDEFGQAASRKKIMKMYRLKHAWADDHEVSIAGSTVTVPGVASLLREIVGGQPAQNEGQAQPESVRKLKGLTGADDYRPDGSKKPVTGGVLDTGIGNLQEDSGLGILADPRLNAVLVWDIQERIHYYDQMIKTLDVPVSLVEIKVVIMDVSTSHLSELGVSWNFTDKRSGTHVGVVGGANVGTGDSAVDFTSNLGAGLNVTTIYTDAFSEIMARVHALQSKGNAKVLSRPAVLTLDNVQAQLESSSSFYVRVPGTYASDLYKISVGTILRVTPHLEETDNGALIKLLVNIEDGAPDTSNEVDDIPSVKKSVINTQAVVGEGQSLVLGGHYYEESSDNVEGIPILQDIPVLGYLFKKKTKSLTQMERLFIITPTIVQPSFNLLPDKAAHQDKLYGQKMKSVAKINKIPTSLVTKKTVPGCAHSPR